MRNLRPPVSALGPIPRFLDRLGSSPSFLSRLYFLIGWIALGFDFWRLDWYLLVPALPEHKIRKTKEAEAVHP